MTAVLPLVERVHARVVAVEEMESADVPLRWEGETVAAVRLPRGDGTAGHAGLGTLLDDLAAELGGPLAELPRADKQRAVRLLEERGAFHYRKSAETVAEALGVTRFTVYNYLNRSRP
nr:helix-turn-helix domain-containing protein [Saccharomonospora saliphila]